MAAKIGSRLAVAINFQLDRKQQQNSFNSSFLSTVPIYCLDFLPSPVALPVFFFFSFFFFSSFFSFFFVVGYSPDFSPSKLSDSFHSDRLLADGFHSDRLLYGS